jgi:hypothetical protein
MTRIGSFVVARNKDGMFLARRPKDGPWPAFENSLDAAVKFRSPEEASEWLTINRVRHVRLFWYPARRYRKPLGYHEPLDAARAVIARERKP